jgi:hypothetical protein
MIACLGLLIGSLLLSALVNFQWAEPLKAKNQLSTQNIKLGMAIDWQSILSQLTQYIPAETSIKPQVILETESNISDATVVGILLNKKRSVLIYNPLQEQLEPMQLKLGEGWLENWILSEIESDFVIWTNQVNNQTYTQPLFGKATNLPNTLDTNSEIN